MLTESDFRVSLVASLVFFTAMSVAHAQYSGGSGTGDDPYEIATAADLIALGETPEDYDKHFILTADIDLDPNLPGRKVFDRAVIAPTSVGAWADNSFVGVLDGNGHRIVSVTISGTRFLGLFGSVGRDGEVRDVSLEGANIVGADGWIPAGPGVKHWYSALCAGALVGYNSGHLIRCGSTGVVESEGYVGGLVGDNRGTVVGCYSTVAVRGGGSGGLVGGNGGSISSSYSTGTVSGGQGVGGLVSRNWGSISSSYSIGVVSGNSSVGGLVGSGGDAFNGVWDVEASGQTGSAGGIGLMTAEMMDPNMLGLNGFANDPNWVLDAGHDYPRLAWEATTGEIIAEPAIDWMAGRGTVDAPYVVSAADQLIRVGRGCVLWDRQFVLDCDIDFAGVPASTPPLKQAVIPVFSGVLEGSGHTISHVVIEGGDNVGLFGRLEWGAKVRNLGMVDVNMVALGSNTGALAGSNCGAVAGCYSTGFVTGRGNVGGLVGDNDGDISSCYSGGTVTGSSVVGGLVGDNCGDITKSHSTATVDGYQNVGGLLGSLHTWLTWPGVAPTINDCYSTGPVTGDENVGGLVGNNNGGLITGSHSTGEVAGNQFVGGLAGTSRGDVSNSYSTANVYGVRWVGGLVGCGRNITHSYSTGSVNGDEFVGGLIGTGSPNRVVSAFWNIDTSGEAASPGGGMGLTTTEMQTASTFLEAGWDFVGETENGPNDVWKIVEGQTYPLLSWQKYGGGTGEPNNPYLIYTAEHLNALGAEPNDYDKHFKLMADIDLSGYVYDRAVIAPDMDPNDIFHRGPSFAGAFDGNNHVISHVTIKGESYLGLFGELVSRAIISNLSLDAADINGTGDYVGGLVGHNWRGEVVRCYCTGTVSGDSNVGGLVGFTRMGSMAFSHGAGMVTGHKSVGGLIGENWGSVDQSSSVATVEGDTSVGGLVGSNFFHMIQCYFAGMVAGHESVGGLAGYNGYLWGVDGMWPCEGTIDMSYCTTVVSGDKQVGGLIGYNGDGLIGTSYSIAIVIGNEDVGGLVGGYIRLAPDMISASFWDAETSGVTSMCGGTDMAPGGCDDTFGLTTAEMQMVSTFLDAGWDFIDETENGVEDIWYMVEGDYPRLWWELEEVLAPVAEVIELDGTSFDETIGEGVVLVDFYATWCSFCVKLEPILEEVAEQVQGRAVVAQLDIDVALRVAKAYGATAVPTLIIFKNGEVFERFLGLTEAAELVAAIERALAD